MAGIAAEGQPDHSGGALDCGQQGLVRCAGAAGREGGRAEHCAGAVRRGDGREEGPARRRRGVPQEDVERQRAHRRPLRREDPLDRGEQDLRVADQPTHRRRPHLHRLPLLLRPLQPGVQDPHRQELAPRDQQAEDPAQR